jgi:hypothetical protein
MKDRNLDSEHYWATYFLKGNRWGEIDVSDHLSGESQKNYQKGKHEHLMI